MSDAALESIEAILARGGDADDVLRAVVASLHEDAGYPWAGILFVEDGGLALGPEAGAPGSRSNATTVPVAWQGERVAELAVEGAEPTTSRSSSRSRRSSRATASSAGTPAASSGSRSCSSSGDCASGRVLVDRTPQLPTPSPSPVVVGRGRKSIPRTRDPSI